MLIVALRASETVGAPIERGALLGVIGPILAVAERGIGVCTERGALLGVNALKLTVGECLSETVGA